MPDIAVHNAMGHRVLKKLAPEIAGTIESKIFDAAVMGPDFYQCYRFFLPRRFRHGVRKRSDIMHSSRTGAFLVELAKAGRRSEMFSFLAGFLCHYALDSTVHPFINREADRLQSATGRRDLHTVIEHRLDVLELQRQGKERKDIVMLLPPFREPPEVRAAIKKIYGWDDTLYQTGYRHMKLYYRLVKDQHGALLFLLNLFYPSRAAKSYQTHLADEADLSPFQALEQEAVELGVKLVTAAFRFRAGSLSEAGLRRAIGNRSYSGGDAADALRPHTGGPVAGLYQLSDAGDLS